MESESRIGIAVVGPGAIAEAHLAAFEAVGGITPIWAIGRTMEGTSAFADRWGIEHAATDIADACADSRVKLALICSPNELHAAQAQAFLLSGKDVILEIPIAMSTAQSVDLVRLAGAQEQRLFACHTMRSFAGIRYMRDLVCSGQEVLTQIQGSFAIPRRNNEGFAGRRSWVDDLLWHHACHLVDATLWVTSIDSVTNPWLLQGHAHADLGMTMDLNLAFATGHPGDPERVIASHALTYNATSLCWQLRFAGRRGDYVFDGGRLTDGRGSVLVEGASIRDLAIQNAEIIDGLRTGSPTVFDAAGILPAMHALDRLQEVAQQA